MKKKSDHIIKSRLKNMETDFDLISGWEDLEPKLKKNNKRRRLFFFLLGLVVISIIGINYYDSNLKSISNNTSLATTENHQDKIQELNNISKKSDTQKVKEVNTEKLNSYESTKEKEQVIVENKSIGKERSLLILGNENQKSKKLVIPNLQITSRGKIDASERNHISHYYNSESNTIIEAASENFIDNLKPINLTTSESVDTRDIIQLSKLTNRLRPIYFDNSTDRYFEANVSSFSQSVLGQQIDKSRFGISLLGGLGIFNSNYKYDQLTEDIESSKKLLSDLEYFNISTKLSYRFSDRLSLSTGFDFMRSNEKFYQYSETNVIREVRGIVKIIVMPSTNDSTFVEGNISQNSIKWKEDKHYNKYTSYSIPVGLSYAANREIFSFGLEIGGIINVTTSKAGREVFESIIVQSESLDFYKNNIGLSIYLEPQFTFALSDKIGLAFNPQFRKSVTNWSKQEDVLLKPIHYGLLFGVNVKL